MAEMREDVALHMATITDWYIPEKKPLDGYLYDDKGSHDIKDVGYEIKEICVRIAEECSDIYKSKGVDFKFEYSDKNEDRKRKNSFRYRVHVIPSTEGNIFALRYIPKEVISSDQLKLPPLVSSVLKSPALSRGGLVIISGETGQGKTTTCSSMILHRIREFGSFALTVEDPPEYFLHGKHGYKNGRCVQTEVFEDDFEAAMKGAMRSYPAQSGSILYIGETRDSTFAHEIIKAVSNGHIVFTTIHGMDIINTINRFVFMCSGKGFSPEEVRQTLAMSLRLVVNQKLEKFTPQSGKTTVHVSCESVFSDGPTSSVANKIISGNIRGLQSDINEQEAKVRAFGPSGVIGDWEKRTR